MQERERVSTKPGVTSGWCESVHDQVRLAYTQHRQYSRGMIERLAPEKLSAVVELLDVRLDTFERALDSAEIDDQPDNAEGIRDFEAPR